MHDNKEAMRKAALDMLGKLPDLDLSKAKMISIEIVMNSEQPSKEEESDEENESEENETYSHDKADKLAKQETYGAE